MDDNVGPIFRRIYKIYEIEKKIYFLLSRIDTVLFNSHYHSYEVTIHQQLTEMINANEVNITCQCLLVQKNETNYVITRHQI